MTVPYDTVHGALTCETEMPPMWAGDDFGGRVYVDGMPDYVPSTLYAGYRNEQGYATRHPLLHDPESEATDDPTYTEGMAEFAYLQGLGENPLRVTCDNDALLRDLVDSDNVSIGAGPMFGDRGYGGYAITVGETQWYWGVIEVDCVLQGGARGVAKKAGKRQINVAATAIKLERSDDGGTTWYASGQAGTNAVGEFILIGGPEKSPATYRIKAAGDPIELGGVVNAELVWRAIAVAQPGHQAITLDESFGQIYRARVDGLDVRVEMLMPATWTWVDIGIALSGKAYTHPSIAFMMTGRCVVMATADHQTETALLTLINGPDANWRTLVNNPADGLENAAECCEDGRLHIVGYASGMVYYRQAGEVAGDEFRLQVFPDAGAPTSKQVCEVSGDPPTLAIAMTKRDKCVILVSPPGEDAQTWTQQGLANVFIQQT